MPILRKCCFCCELETGANCIAYLGIFQTLMSIVALIFGSSGSGNEKLVQIIALLIPLSIYGLMVYGTMKRQHNYLLPWLIINFIGNILFGIYIIVLFIAGISSLDSTSENFSTEIVTIFIMIIFALAILGLSVHIFLAVYSLYVKIREENNQLRTIPPV